MSGIFSTTFEFKDVQVSYLSTPSDYCWNCLHVRFKLRVFVVRSDLVKSLSNHELAKFDISELCLIKRTILWEAALVQW